MMAIPLSSLVSKSCMMLDDIHKYICESEEHYTVTWCKLNEDECLVLHHKQLHHHPPTGPVSRCKIIINARGDYVVYILLREFERGNIIESPVPLIRDVCSKFSPYSCKFKFCPGIEVSQYDSYKEKLRFDVKRVEIKTTPFQRISSSSCKVWHELKKKPTREKLQAEEVLCQQCIRLKCHLEYSVKRKNAESPSKKQKRLHQSSTARLTFMSPDSQLKRKKNQKIVHETTKRKLQYYEENITLGETQSEEMASILSVIEEKCSTELEEIFVEGEKHGVASRMKEIWKSDKSSEMEQFSQDQRQNSCRLKKNKWSLITIRIALAVFIRSPAAYDALKSFNILQLPSRSTLQAYKGSFLHQPGANHECILEQVAQFLVYCEERKKEGKKESIKAGVLVFDEVRVISKLIWNSRNQSVVGLCMTHHEQSTLTDIYQMMTTSRIEQTSYILQFLWRDLTSDFDIVGPYFNCSKTLESKFIFSCVMETVKLFHLHGLKTLLLVCDGASVNLSTLKATHGHFGAYPIKPDEEDPLKVSPYMINPFDPPNKIYWLICPSHQLKNMINALFSSKDKGTKEFLLNGSNFGWDAIISLYARDCQRVSNGLTRMVPKMKESYIIRDAWTKLNVAPAKIMQQDHVLMELSHYIIHNPDADDLCSVRNTLSFLEACAKIFENGLLSHSKVTHMKSETITLIEDGFSFFAKWLDDILNNDPNFEYSNAAQKKFLAWQTFDLLRIDVYGFKAFCEEFLTQYPDYFVSPLRLSGSSIESLFSQYKYCAGGKLDAANYSVARASNLIKQTVKNHHSGADYRNSEINTTLLPL